ncbi:hypothetical protein [Methylobacterium fujisawaense]|uniref:hypothetical protein n=1 Tax=Methylobacterium fujisawaense TaxID=107400 RepID=UPI00244AEE63|nr:hypothetical protein [Methylobacterium fujisawaense]MDH3031446.1 hypothetical protein [Methylobacterium fujisawaense]
MRLFKGFAFAASLCVASYAVQASPGDCYLSVGSRTYLDGSCNIDLSPGGSFSIGAGERRRSRYFAMVNINESDGTALAYWNGVDAESHAHDDLGTVVRRGGCWVNSRAKVCAWKHGTRPDRF